MNIDKPIVFYDVESTGLDVVKDRIIELALIKINPDGTRNEKSFLFNPGMPIPAASTVFHGYRDEDVANEPRFGEDADVLYSEFFEGSDIGGYNLKGIDICMLSEEFHKAGIEWPPEDMKIYDAFVIFQKQHPRDLETAVKFYLEKEMEGAHKAANDIKYTLEVFEEQQKRYFQNVAMDIIASYCKDEKTVDYHRKLCKNDKGEICYNFGKHRDVPVIKEPGYAHWMLDQSFTENTKMHLRKILGIAKPVKQENDFLF